MSSVLSKKISNFRLVINSFRIKPSGFSTTYPDLRQRLAKVLNTLTGLTERGYTQVLLSSKRVYKQNPFLVSAVSGFSIVSLIFVTVIYSLVARKPGTPNPGEDRLSASHATPVKIKYDLSMIALGFIEDDSWSKQHIERFADGWNQLDTWQKSQLKQTVWFQLLENILRRKIDTHPAGVNQLVRLSALLESALPGNEPPKTIHAKAPTPQSRPAVTGITKTRKQQPPSINHPRIEKVNIAANEISTPAAPLVPTAYTANHPKKQAAPVENDQPNTPTASVAPLDSAMPTTKQHNRQTEVVPATSANLTPNASTIPKKAHRAGKVIRKPLPLGDQQTAAPTTAGGTNEENAQQPAAEQTPTAQPNTAATTINSIREPEIDEPKIHEPKIHEPKILKPELRQITTKLIRSYEAGDLAEFASLFAEKAVSNDETDLQTIRKEYANLFATTSERRMIIDNLKWKLSSNTATGEGTMEVSVKSGDVRKTQTYSGTVQIVVEKQDDNLQITELYHALQ